MQIYNYYYIRSCFYLYRQTHLASIRTEPLFYSGIQTKPSWEVDLKPPIPIGLWVTSTPFCFRNRHAKQFGQRKVKSAERLPEVSTLVKTERSYFPFVFPVRRAQLFQLLSKDIFTRLFLHRSCELLGDKGSYTALIPSTMPSAQWTSSGCLAEQ